MGQLTREGTFSRPLHWGTAAALLCHLGTVAGQAQSTGVEHVFIVCIDGLRPDVLRNAVAPNIDNLLSVGAVSWSAQTVSPSVTLPATCSLVTGVLPQTHGVTWNDDRPATGYPRSPTVFAVARAQGCRTAMFVSKAKLACLATPGAVDVCEVIVDRAKAVATAAARHIMRARPNLCLVHFSDVDGAGHAWGWGSRQQLEAMGVCDQAIGVLLSGIHGAGIADRSVMIVTSDHGGHGNGHGSSDPLDMTVPWICAGKGVAMRYQVTTRVSTMDTPAVALWALGVALPQGWQGRLVPGVFPRRGRTERPGAVAGQVQGPGTYRRALTAPDAPRAKWAVWTYE